MCNNGVPELVIKPDECIHWFLGRHPEGHNSTNAGDRLGVDHLEVNTHSSLHHLDLVVQSFDRMFQKLCDAYIMFDPSEFKYLHDELKLYVRELEVIKDMISKAFKLDQYFKHIESMLIERKLTRFAKRFFASEWAQNLCIGKVKLEISNVFPNKVIKDNIRQNWRSYITNLISEDEDGSLVKKGFVKIDQIIDTEVKQKATEIHEAYSKRYKKISSALSISNMKKLKVMSLVMLMIFLLPSFLLWLQSLKTYVQKWTETRYKYWHDFSNYVGWILGERLRNSTWLLNDQEKENKGTKDVVCQSKPRAELWFYSIYLKPYEWEEVLPLVQSISDMKPKITTKSDIPPNHKNSLIATYERAVVKNPTFSKKTVGLSEKPIEGPHIQQDLFVLNSKPMRVSPIKTNNSQPLTVVDNSPDSTSILRIKTLAQIYSSSRAQTSWTKFPNLFAESLDPGEPAKPYLVVSFVKWLFWFWVWVGADYVLLVAIQELLIQVTEKMNSKGVKRDQIAHLIFPTLFFSHALLFYLMATWY